MTLQQLHQRIGRIQRACANLERTLVRADRLADTCGHPDQAENARLAQHVRGNLMKNFTELHALEARLPTPELLSERAYNRALMLGLEVEAAEEQRRSTYQAAAKPTRKPYERTGHYSKTKPVTLLDLARDHLRGHFRGDRVA